MPRHNKQSQILNYRHFLPIFSKVLHPAYNNAIKFTHNSTIKVYCDWHLKDGKKYLDINIQDTGISIDEKNISNVFKPFTQTDQAANRQYEGTGLGLTVRKQLCEILGGDIYLESTPGEDSTFTISLPELAASDIINIEHTYFTETTI